MDVIKWDDIKRPASPEHAAKMWERAAAGWEGLAKEAAGRAAVLRWLLVRALHTVEPTRFPELYAEICGILDRDPDCECGEDMGGARVDRGLCLVHDAGVHDGGLP